MSVSVFLLPTSSSYYLYACIYVHADDDGAGRDKGRGGEEEEEESQDHHQRDYLRREGFRRIYLHNHWGVAGQGSGRFTLAILLSLCLSSLSLL